jgi:hypothetical protein
MQGVAREKAASAGGKTGDPAEESREHILFDPLPKIRPFRR